FVNRIIIRPYFGPAHAKLTCETLDCCLRARSGSYSGFLSPPAPRGADGPGQSSVLFNPQSFRPAVAGLFFSDDRRRTTENWYPACVVSVYFRQWATPIHAPSVLRRPSPVLRVPSSVLCRLSSAFRPLSSVLRRLLSERRECRAEDDPRLVVGALLHHDGGSIDLVGFDIGDRNGPGRISSCPVAELQPAPHDIVVRDGSSTILAAADGDRHSSRQRT